MVKIKKYLYYNSTTKQYQIRRGRTITSQDKTEIMEIYNQCQQAEWKPTEIMKIIEEKQKQKGYTTRQVRKIRVNKNNENYTLFIKGFYITTGTIPKIKKTIQEYIQTGYNDQFIDMHTYQQSHPHNPEKYISYIPRVKKYRVSRTTNNGQLHYYGQYNTLEEARNKKQQLIQEGWPPPTRKRKKYNTNPETRFIQKTSTGKYAVMRNGTYYGTFRTLKDAQEERDWLIENDWNYENIDLY